MADKKVQAAEAVVQSMRTGERVASSRAAEHLADNVVLDTGRKGAALLIDVVRLQGGGPKGNYRMQKE